MLVEMVGIGIDSFQLFCAEVERQPKKERKTIEWERLEISSRKIRDTEGIFHAKIDSVKDKNGMDLTEAEDIKKRWQEYTELYKKDLHDPDNHDGVITHQRETSWNVKSSRT